MVDRAFTLAIEITSARGSVALGRGDDLLETLRLEQTRRHNVELMPAIDVLCKNHHARPADLQHIFVSIGPGSFTGLRIAVATAKMLAIALHTKIVAVPTMESVIRNVPAQDTPVAVCMSAKREHHRMYVGVYRAINHEWQGVTQPTLMMPEELCERVPGPLDVLGEHLPEHNWPADVTLLDPELAISRAEVVWQLGQALAKQQQFADPWMLVPLYVRRPEVEEKLLAKGQL